MRLALDKTREAIEAQEKVAANPQTKHIEYKALMTEIATRIPGKG